MAKLVNKYTNTVKVLGIHAICRIKIDIGRIAAR